MSVPPTLVHGAGSFVTDIQGRRFLDLANGYGAVFLGHARAEIAERLAAQGRRLWVSAGFRSAAEEAARAAVSRVLPPGLRLTGFYSTGMEAVEFALRVAAAVTGRKSFCAFARSMHGKSALTANLCWPNSLLACHGVHTLSGVGETGEAEALERLERLLQGGEVAAVLVEPIQGSNGGVEASVAFYERLMELCAATGTLTLFDEVLTGLYRTGPACYASRLGRTPDLLVFSKNIATGFPASAVALAQRFDVPPGTLPGSTFAGNPLACAAILGTLEAMEKMEMQTRVGAIEETVRRALAGLADRGVALRGRGALWFLDLGPAGDLRGTCERLARRGILALGAGNFLRLLPSALIDPDTLAQACDTIMEVCMTTADRDGCPGARA